ncbi:50S ribosomal protein L1 [Candidatus Peregrinibacteria bacterium CG10_big_fil_rev_8_21_14_0_10_36_19]|nr:MAG: 50S ribosomal protein L1 [Candidatus Peregrinibacteria bacterium CG10_big_fil_rev_8_21_14_0_10_36_19]
MSGKKYTEAKALITKEAYIIDEAIELLKKTSTTKFDSSCEVHFRLGVDPKQADQNIRTTAALPHGTGKDVTVVAFVGEENVKEALEAGAAVAGTAELVKKIEGGWLDFDVAIASPDQMKDLAKVAKTLGQKRLMPSPKAGTVTPEFVKVIGELKKGKIELRVDKFGNLHNLFGKVSFDESKLKENLKSIIKTVLEVKPSSSKGTYVRSLTLTTTMGPGIPLDANAAIAECK